MKLKISVKQPGKKHLLIDEKIINIGSALVDDDSTSAELISTVLLMARDHEIQDPTILSRLR
jgi:hypothetical protein